MQATTEAAERLKAMTTGIAPSVGADLLGQQSAERNQDATAYVGNLDPPVSEELLWELFVQTKRVVNVYVPKDRVTNSHQGYGFVEFRSEEDADHAIKALNMINLYGKLIRVNKASQDKKSMDVGANLFIRNLDPDVDEKLLYDTFSAFEVIVTNPKIMRDPETGNSLGFGFISYDSFEASDAAIEAMNGQYLRNRQITVSYAYKKTQRASVMIPLQKEFWLLVIEMCRKADHIPGLRADLLHFKMLLKQVLTLLLLFLHGLLLTLVFLHPFHHSDHQAIMLLPMPLPPLQSWEGQTPSGQTALPPPPVQQFRSLPPPPPQIAPAFTKASTTTTTTSRRGDCSKCVATTTTSSAVGGGPRPMPPHMPPPPPGNFPPHPPPP